MQFLLIIPSVFVYCIFVYIFNISRLSFSIWFHYFCSVKSLWLLIGYSVSYYNIYYNVKCVLHFNNFKFCELIWRQLQSKCHRQPRPWAVVLFSQYNLYFINNSDILKLIPPFQQKNRARFWHKLLTKCQQFVRRLPLSGRWTVTMKMKALIDVSRYMN